MSIHDMLEPIAPSGGRVHLPGAADWMQGRTLYGGASSLVAYTAAIRAFPDLPRLRSAQVSFIGPVGADLKLETKIIRAGRNVTQVGSYIYGPDDGMVLSAQFIFGAARTANALHNMAVLPDFPTLSAEEDVYFSANAPAFVAKNYEVRRCVGPSDKSIPQIRRWIRLKERNGLDAMSELVLIGDTLPPGAMRAMQRMGPLSSVNWSFNVIDANCKSDDGWWLAETTSEWADEGYSSERLRLWNPAGTQALSGMQSVAIFG